MEKEISSSSKGTYLVSVRLKTSNDQGKIYVVSASALNVFIEKNLTSDVVLLIDTIDTYGLDS